MTAMVFDLAAARRARFNGERSLLHTWVPKDGPAEIEDFRVGDTVKFRDGRVGTILCFGASSIRGPADGAGRRQRPQLHLPDHGAAVGRFSSG